MAESDKEIPIGEIQRMYEAFLKFEKYGLVEIIQVPDDLNNLDATWIIRLTEKGLKFAKMLDPSLSIEDLPIIEDPLKPEILHQG